MDLVNPNKSQSKSTKDPKKPFCKSSKTDFYTDWSKMLKPQLNFLKDTQNFINLKDTTTFADFGTTKLFETDADDENWKIFAAITFHSC